MSTRCGSGLGTPGLSITPAVGGGHLCPPDKPLSLVALGLTAHKGLGWSMDEDLSGIQTYLCATV